MSDGDLIVLAIVSEVARLEVGKGRFADICFDGLRHPVAWVEDGERQLPSLAPPIRAALLRRIEAVS